MIIEQEAKFFLTKEYPENDHYLAYSGIVDSDGESVEYFPELSGPKLQEKEKSKARRRRGGTK